jgi:hypothetical protein
MKFLTNSDSEEMRVWTVLLTLLFSSCTRQSAVRAPASAEESTARCVIGQLRDSRHFFSVQFNDGDLTPGEVAEIQSIVREVAEMMPFTKLPESMTVAATHELTPFWIRANLEEAFDALEYPEFSHPTFVTAFQLRLGDRLNNVVQAVTAHEFSHILFKHRLSSTLFDAEWARLNPADLSVRVARGRLLFLRSMFDELLADTVGVAYTRDPAAFRRALRHPDPEAVKLARGRSFLRRQRQLNELEKQNPYFALNLVRGQLWPRYLKPARTPAETAEALRKIFDAFFAEIVATVPEALAGPLQIEEINRRLIKRLEDVFAGP